MTVDQVHILLRHLVMAPIIESCTKDSISLGKGWIFTKAVSHDSNQLIAHYLAFRVTDDSAPFTLKLHLVRSSNVIDSQRKVFEIVASSISKEYSRREINDTLKAL